MASTVVGFYFPTSASSPAAKFHDTNGHASALSTPTLTQDAERESVWKGTVTEALAGWYSVDLYDGSDYLRTTFIYLADDTGTYFESDPNVIDTIVRAIKTKTDTIARVTWLISDSTIDDGGVMTIKAGDKHVFRLTSTVEDAVPDLTAITCRFGIYDASGNEIYSSASAVSVVTATGFQAVDVTLLPADTIDFPPGAALFDVQAEYAADDIRTFISGSVQILADYSGTA